ncbi:hypothetical protein EBZ38_03405 [bacterium]|nr:hypothetical protein [bacterium]NDD83314.1 hypothetical protein [bacterium]
MQMIDLEEPMTKKEQAEIKKALEEVYKKSINLEDVLFKTKQINGYVEVAHNEKYVLITNTKGGHAEVYLKARTFAKIAKELGYVRGE